MQRHAFAAALAALAVAAPSVSQAQTVPGAFAAVHYTTPLAGICPSPFVVQKDWLMESEHGAFYQLIGGGGKMQQGRYEGALGATGITMIVLEGGSGLGMGDGETPYSALYAGNTKAGLKPHMGFVGTDNALIFSQRFPVVGVVTPLDQDPTALIFDPATYPKGFKSLDDLKALARDDKAKIYVSTTKRTFGKYLVDAGVPQSLFVEGYRGDLENFVAHTGAWLNQGFVTSEVWDLTNGRNWKKPVNYVLLSDLGYRPYPSVPSVAKDRLEELRPCLQKLVPLIQQAQIDYVKSPDEVDTLMAAFNGAGLAAGFWKTSKDQLDAAARIAVTSGVVANGRDGAMGSFDFARIGAVQTILAPGLDNRAAPNLKPEDIATNAFIDPKIALPPR